MNSNPLLSTEVQFFINKNIDSIISKLALQKNPFPDLDWISVLNQIEAKKNQNKNYLVGLLPKISFIRLKFPLSKPHLKLLQPINPELFQAKF